MWKQKLESFVKPTNSIRTELFSFAQAFEHFNFDTVESKAGTSEDSSAENTDDDGKSESDPRITTECQSSLTPITS